MKWIKHDTNANQDAKLKRIRMKYGLEGYGLYWYCLELIAADVDQNNLTFELEHDAEIIAHDTGIHYERVNEMMAYMVNLGLFEEDKGVMSCLKLAARLDKSMTSSPLMRKMLGELKVNSDKVMTKPDPVMTQSAKPMQDKIRLDKIRLDKIRLDKKRLDKKATSKKTPTKTKKTSFLIPDSVCPIAWGNFVEHRELGGKKFTDKAKKMAANKLAKFTLDEQQAAVENSIISGWTGIFPESAKNNNFKTAEQKNNDLSEKLFGDDSVVPNIFDVISDKSNNVIDGEFNEKQ